MLFRLFAGFGLAVCLMSLGCGDSASTDVIDIPSDNPYQASPEELEAYNAKRAEESKAMRAANK